MKTRAACLILALCFCASALPAQTHRWELTPFIGFETRGSYPLQNALQVDRLRANANISFGTFLDYSVSDNFQAEFLWAHNPTQYSERNIATGQYTKAFNTQIDQYQFGGLILLRDDRHKVRPYMATGLGFTRDSNSGGNPSRTAFAFNIGGGLKYEVNRFVGFRSDVRWIPTYGSSSPGTYCDPFGFCYPATIRNYLQRVNLSTGVSIRF
jgi:hypothetical protein